jgi:hypothetical protein
VEYNKNKILRAKNGNEKTISVEDSFINESESALFYPGSPESQYLMKRDFIFNYFHSIYFSNAYFSILKPLFPESDFIDYFSLLKKRSDFFLSVDRFYLLPMSLSSFSYSSCLLFCFPVFSTMNISLHFQKHETINLLMCVISELTILNNLCFPYYSNVSNLSNSLLSILTSCSSYCSSSSFFSTNVSIPFLSSLLSAFENTHKDSVEENLGNLSSQIQNYLFDSQSSTSNLKIIGHVILFSHYKSFTKQNSELPSCSNISKSSDKSKEKDGYEIHNYCDIPYSSAVLIHSFLSQNKNNISRQHSDYGSDNANGRKERNARNSNYLVDTDDNNIILISPLQTNVYLILYSSIFVSKILYSSSETHQKNLHSFSDSFSPFFMFQCVVVYGYLNVECFETIPLKIDTVSISTETNNYLPKDIQPFKKVDVVFSDSSLTINKMRCSILSPYSLVSSPTSKETYNSLLSLQKSTSDKLTPSFFYFSPLLSFFSSFFSFLQTSLIIFSSLLVCTFLLYQNDVEKYNQIILKAFYLNNRDKSFVKIPSYSPQLIFSYVIINLPSGDSSDFSIHYAYCSCCGNQRRESISSFCKQYVKDTNVSDSENNNYFGESSNFGTDKLLSFNMDDLAENISYCPHILGIFLYCLRQNNPSSKEFFTSFPALNSIVLSDTIPSSFSCLFSPNLLLNQMHKSSSSSIYQFLSYSPGDFRDEILYDNIIECDIENGFHRKLDFSHNMRITDFSIFLEYFVHQPTFYLFPDFDLNQQMRFSMPLIFLKNSLKV